MTRSHSSRNTATHKWLIVTLALLLGAVLTTSIRARRDSLGDPSTEVKRQFTQSQIEALESAIWCYRSHLKRFPPTLEALIVQASDTANTHAGKGPYTVTGLLQDHWGRNIGYLSPGRHNPQCMDIWSCGPDGVLGTAD